jgi:hypothetical protein
MDLKAYCTSGHEAQLMLVISKIDPDDPRRFDLTCPQCNRTNSFLIYARREVAIKQQEDGEGVVEI